MCLIVVKTLQLALIINRSFNVIINFSSVVYSGFYPRTVKNLVYIILPPKHEALRSNTKQWLSRNEDNVSEWNDKFISSY